MLAHPTTKFQGRGNDRRQDFSAHGGSGKATPAVPFTALYPERNDAPDWLSQNLKRFLNLPSTLKLGANLK